MKQLVKQFKELTKSKMRRVRCQMTKDGWILKSVIEVDGRYHMDFYRRE